MELPQSVDEWTLGTITDLLHEGYDENQFLEFKKLINPNSERIGKTVCAFANSAGGTLVIGIDSDRKKNYHERIIGLENNDQLKRQILDHINNIKPNIPAENLQFKKNNIFLQDGNVVIVLQISPSISQIHQYEHIFYKRLPDGNHPMEVEEILNKILSSRQNYTLFNLLLIEGGVIRGMVNVAKEGLARNDLDYAITQFELIPNDAFLHFLYNQAHLHSIEIQNCIYSIVEISKKLSYDVGRIFDDEKETKRKLSSEEKKQYDVSTTEEFLKKFVESMADLLLEDLNKFESLTKSKLTPPRNLLDLAKKS